MTTVTMVTRLQVKGCKPFLVTCDGNRKDTANRIVSDAAHIWQALTLSA